MDVGIDWSRDADDVFARLRIARPLRPRAGSVALERTLCSARVSVDRRNTEAV